MNWSDVTITLHKQPLPVCQSEEYTSVPWLGVSPDSGSVAAGATDEVTVSVDADELTHGEHVGYLCIETNDTGADNLKLVAVPVEVMVFDPDVGALEGTVTTEGYCSASDPVPVAGATVVAEGQDGTFETQTGSDGEYYFDINENESPLTVTVSLEGYLNAVEEDVDVISGETTRQPFNLLVAEPCGDVEPDSFDFDLTLGDTASDTLSLSNEDGNVDLEWTLAAFEGDSCEGDEPGWLTLGAEENAISPGDSEDVSISVDTASLADGSYLATLCLDSNDDQLGSVQIPVTVDVTDPALGTVEGQVMALNCQEDPEPLANALIIIEGQGDSWTTSTDADGMYSIKVSEDESPVDVTASADDYFPVTEDGVTIIGLETEEINFDLTLDAACIDVNPDEFNVTVDLGQTADESLEIANLGSRALDWTVVLPDETGGLATALAEERLAAGLPEIHISDFVADPADEEAGTDRASRSVAGPGQPWVTGTARASLLQEGVLLVPQHVNGRIMAFDPETGALIDENFIVFEESLGTLQHVLPHPDGERLLVVSQSGEIHAFSVEDGDYIGVFAPTAGDDPDVIGNTRGMAIHPDTGNILVTSASGSNANAVVEFDQDGNYLGVFVENGSGGISGPWSILFREHDVLVSASGGNIYSYDHNGEFIQVWNDEINFPEQIQEIDSGNVLAAAFSAPSGAWELSADGEQIGVYGPETSLRGVHELPGGTILVTNSGGVHEIDRESNLLGTLIDGSSYQISLVQTMDCELPDWLTPDPLDGSVDSGDPADSVALTFDPAGMAPGEYEGNICIESNDPIQPVVQVPVSMEVVLPADWGTVEGSVESLGHCDENPVPLAGASVSINGQGDSWSLETDDEGFYQLFVPAAESPLEIEVSAEGHITASATVTFGGGETVTENFSLYLDEPCASVSPDEISFTMDADDTRSGIVQLSNSGHAPLSWQIDTTMPSELRRHGGSGEDGGSAASAGPNAGAVSLADVLGGALPGLTVGQPLVDVADCSDDPDLIIHDDGTVENGYAWGAANSWGTFVDRFTPENYPIRIDMVCVAFLRAAGGPSSIDFEVVFYADDGPGGEPGTEIAAVLATADGIPDGIDSDPSWTAVDVSEADVSIAAGSVYIGARWAPSSPNVYIASDESTERPAGYAGGYSASDQGSGGDWESILSGFDEYRALFVRAAGGGMNCSDPIGVPWLSASPAFGPAIGAGQSLDISVELNSAGLLPGEYSAGLCIFTNDPGNPVTMVPVELEVRAPAAWAAVEGVVESAGYCGSEPGALADAAVELVGGTDIWTAVTDEDGHYSISLPASEGPVDIHVEADGHEPETLTGITLSAGQTVTQDFSLTLQAPCATAEPDKLEFALTAGENGILELEIGNVDGTTDLEWSIEEAPQVDSRAHFPALPYQAEHKSADGISLHRDVSDSAGSLVNSPLMPAEMAVPAFSTTGWTAPGYAMLDALVPGVLDIINPNQPEDVYAAAFIDNDLDRHYMIVSGNDGNQPANTFGYVEVATGEFTGLGTLSGDLAETWTSMSWDHATRTLYASGSTLLGNSLFVIDPDALTATEVGEITGPDLAPDAIVIAIAVSPEGLMYGLDIIDDVLLAIDKDTGEASVVGPVGEDANFAQDMDFDQSDGTLYWAGYMGGGDSRMMTIDVETGAASQLGAVDDGVELLSFTIAIPGSHGDACVVRESVEWLGYEPVSGTIAGGESETVHVQADASELEAGKYEAWLCIDTSDEERPLIAVPVTLDVDAAPADDLIFEDRFEGQGPAP
ncbi:MAG TPA: carboxypeptidase regulatory-like domain-containing protein [Wenzhouxiangella sp.]|nr:carboxypeptidase regulatory-like domain-containing protein [Wenzhouxiangella sp.]